MRRTPREAYDVLRDAAASDSVISEGASEAHGCSAEGTMPRVDGTDTRSLHSIRGLSLF